MKEHPDTVLLYDTDPTVMAARQAERRLFDHYGLVSTDHTITLPRLGLRVRVTEVGSGPPLVIVPGNTGDGFPFIPLLPHLPGRRVFIVNRPGGGLSDGMDHRTIGFRDLAVHTLTTVLDGLGLDRVPLVAHSMGGHWSQWFAMERPDRVTALALLGVPGNVLTTCPPLALRLASVRGLNRVLVRATIPRGKGDALSGLKVVGHSPQTIARLPAALADCCFAFQRLPNYQISTRTLMETTNRLRGSRPGIRITAAQLGAVRAPTLLLWGDQDPFGDLDTMQRIAQRLPDCRLHVLRGGGHLPWLDNPTTAGALVMDLLRDTELLRESSP